MALIKLNDAQIYYQWDGPEKAPVVVFSNSLGTSHRMWDPELNAFTRDFRVLRYDSRGHGQSSSTPGPYTIERGWGVYDPAMDPTRDETYKFLEGFIAEMAGVRIREKDQPLTSLDLDYVYVGGKTLLKR